MGDNHAADVQSQLNPLYDRERRRCGAEGYRAQVTGWPTPEELARAWHEASEGIRTDWLQGAAVVTWDEAAPAYRDRLIAVAQVVLDQWDW